MMAENLALTYYSDVLCVWAHISQARVDEVAEQFADDVSIDYRFCSVFGDTAYKIGIGWVERGGYGGFGKHLREAVSETVGVSVNDVQEAIDCGAAHADLEADHRDQQILMVQGSSTFILNEGRQKLYGNVGYGVIEANIKELLRSPMAGAASWC
jgi:predicted DsbA family dithiol-disulfide isomerase